MPDESSINDSWKHSKELTAYAYQIANSEHQHIRLSNLHRLLEQRKLVCKQLTQTNSMESETLLTIIDELNRNIMTTMMIPLPKRKLK